MRRIVLVSCVKRKQKSSAKAKDLYTSTLFQSNLQYAYRLKPDVIYILSAKYGLVDLDQVIAPYDMTLNTMFESEKKTWARKVLDSLKQKANLEEDLFILLAGDNYRKYLIPELKHYEIPLEGLSFGRQLRELKRRIT